MLVSIKALIGAGGGRCLVHQREGLEGVVVVSEWRRGWGLLVCVDIGFEEVRARV